LSSRIAAIGMIFMVVALSVFPGCGEAPRERSVDSIPWDRVIAGLEQPTDSADYLAAVVSLSRTWAEHGAEGTALWFRHGLRIAGLGSAGAIGGLPSIFGVPSDVPDDKMIGAVMSALTPVAKASSDEDFRQVVLLVSAYGNGGVKQLQPIVELADRGDGETAHSLRLCLAPILADALIQASQSLPGERGRVILDRIPGWPSPPTRDVTQTLFPGNLARISRWINDGLTRGGLEAKAWNNMAARLRKGFGARMFDLPAVLTDEPRSGSPVSAVVGRFTPLEVAHVKADGVDFAVRPVIAWQETYMSLVSGDATWSSLPPAEGTAPKDISIETLAARAAAIRELALKLEKGVYPTLVGTAMGERSGRSVLVVVDSDATAELLVRAVRTLAIAGYSDFRLVPPGVPGSVNPFMETRDTGSLARARTARVFLTTSGASIFPHPGGELVVDFMPAGVEPIPSAKRINGLFVPWDAARGFSASLAQAFSSLGLSAAGRVDVAEIVPVRGDVPAMMIVDAVSELQASPGVQFSKFETYFPGLTCPQGRSCPGVVPVLGADLPVPSAVR